MRLLPDEWIYDELIDHIRNKLGWIQGMKYERDDKVDPWLERLAWLMDKSIPIGDKWSIGLDPLLGLIPGLGDALGGAISTIIISRALRDGLPRSAVIRMVLNVAVDSFSGSIPFVGDLFDFAFKANSKNIAIYREALRGERNAKKDWLFIALVALIMLALLAIPLSTLVLLARLIF
jgi:hypothetical protein